MDGLFDIRHEAVGRIPGRRSGTAGVRKELLITLAVIVLTVGALLTLDGFGFAPMPAVEFPGLQDIGLQNVGPI